MATLTDIIPFPGVVKESTYLLLISPESIPHLCIVHGGLYYSLTYRGCEIGKDFSVYLQALVRGKRKMLFIEIPGVITNPWNIFKKYEKLSDTDLTCIVPVKETLMPQSSAEFVFELIPELKEQGRIRAVYHLNMESDLHKSAEFTLREYSKEAIYTYIKSLNERELKRH